MSPDAVPVGVDQLVEVRIAVREVEQRGEELPVELLLRGRRTPLPPGFSTSYAFASVDASVTSLKTSLTKRDDLEVAGERRRVENWRSPGRGTAGARTRPRTAAADVPVDEHLDRVGRAHAAVVVRRPEADVVGAGLRRTRGSRSIASRRAAGSTGSASGSGFGGLTSDVERRRSADRRRPRSSVSVRSSLPGSVERPANVDGRRRRCDDERRHAVDEHRRRPRRSSPSDRRS